MTKESLAINLLQKDINELSLRPRLKKAIITGVLSDTNGKRFTDEDRDHAIITALVASGYSNNFIKELFFNNQLGCSNRQIEKGEEQFHADYDAARHMLGLTKKTSSYQAKAIQCIKGTLLNSEEKLNKVANYIVENLFKGDKHAGNAYRDSNRKVSYYFDNVEKSLLNVEDFDFHFFLKDRFEIPEKDYPEVLSKIKTHIWKYGQETRAHRFAYYNEAKNVLYVSNNDNQIYRLNGKNIEQVDNGTDGIIFVSNIFHMPINVDLNNLDSCDYFKGGFDWERFQNSNSSIHNILIGRANFAEVERHSLSPDDQKYLLTIYIYSLFFESILQDKPILCFEGVKASGKSFIATSIGKFLFGHTFQPGSMPDNPRDLSVALSENYFIVCDNVDSGIKPSFIDMLCRSATGAEIRTRKLYTDLDEVVTHPRIFIAITSREPKFKRDDFVDRFLLFNTEKVRNPISRTALNKEISDNRDNIWAEILINLNSIVALLKKQSDWNPAGISRIADWELFGRKIHSESSCKDFVALLEKMNKEKNRFSLEDDPLYELLKFVIHENQDGEEKAYEDVTAATLFSELKNVAEGCGMAKEFERKYKSSIALGKRIRNVLDELSDEFKIEINKAAHGNINKYTIRKKDDDDWPLPEGEDQDNENSGEMVR